VVLKKWFLKVVIKKNLFLKKWLRGRSLGLRRAEAQKEKGQANLQERFCAKAKASANSEIILK